MVYSCDCLLNIHFHILFNNLSLLRVEEYTQIKLVFLKHLQLGVAMANNFGQSDARITQWSLLEISAERTMIRNECLYSLKFTCWNLIPNMMVFRSGVLGSSLGYVVELSWMGVMLSWKEGHASVCHMRKQEVGRLKPRRGLPPEPSSDSTLTSDFQSQEQWEMHFCEDQLNVVDSISVGDILLLSIPHGK